MKRAFVSGVTASEYGLIAVLVGLASMAGLTLLGGNVNHLFANMLDMDAQVAGPVQGVPSHHAPAVIVPQRQAMPGATISHTITLEDGRTITYETLPNLVRSVETIGVNGTMEVLLQGLESMTQALEAAGELTPEQADSLYGLAKQGHRLAEIERLLEDAAARATSSSDYAAMQLVFEGQTYTPGDLRMLFGWDGEHDEAKQKAINTPLDSNGAFPELKAFLDLYNEAQQSGAMQDPAVAREVESLTGHIAFLTELTNSTTYSVIKGDVAPDGLTDLMASFATARDAQQICSHSGENCG